MICGKTLKDKIRNECIREITGVESTTEVMKSQRLRWYRHVERMTEEKALIMARKNSCLWKKNRQTKEMDRAGNRRHKEKQTGKLDSHNKCIRKKGCKNWWTPASTNKHQVSINEETNGR